MFMGHDAAYWAFSAGIPLIFLLAVLGIVSRTAARRTGSGAAASWFLPLAVIALLFIVGQAGYDLLSAAAQRWASTGFFLSMSLFFTMAMIHSSWRRRQAGDPLLDLGPPEATRRLGLLAFLCLFALLAGRSALAVAETGFRSLADLSELLMWLTGTGLWLSALRSRVQITERGIVAFGELVEWERVLAHEWMVGGTERLMLKVRRQFPTLGTRIGVMILPVPPPDRGAVEGILARYPSSARND
jgi:hypothetical protein